MKEQLFELVVTAIGIATVTTGIVEVIKKEAELHGLQVIGLAIFVAVVLLGLVAYVFGYPMGESLLLGLITGFASVGAFNGFQQTKETIGKD